MCDVIDAMKADAGIDVRALRVDGGASANNFLMQFQADMIDAPVNRPACVESTAIGAAYLAGLCSRILENKRRCYKNQRLDRVFTPDMAPEEREAKRKGWNKAVKYAYGWAKTRRSLKTNKILGYITDMIFPPRCPVCDEILGMTDGMVHSAQKLFVSG